MQSDYLILDKLNTFVDKPQNLFSFLSAKDAVQSWYDEIKDYNYNNPTFGYDTGKYIKDIYIFEVNTKYISSSVLKTSELSRVSSTSEIRMFTTHEMKYIWYFPRKSTFSFNLYFIYRTEQTFIRLKHIQLIVTNQNTYM